MDCRKLICILTLTTCGLDGVADDDVYIDFLRPLLKERCYSCHGALKQEAGLRLDTAKLLLSGSESGSVVDGGSVANSILIKRLVADVDSGRMPPDGKALTAEEIEYFTKWITEGATAPEDEVPEADPSEHWAFKVPVRPIVPEGEDSSWPTNPIDSFIQHRRHAEGLTPLPDASPEHLLRRVCLDLTGLPPSLKQLRDFTADPSPDRYRQIVNALLDSPQYGERWGRHWMDVWRYSDWYGRREQDDVRNSAPQIWRWRDWIIDSLNADKGYDRMVQEMLAADEIAAEDDTAWPATGYLIRSYYSLNPNEWMRHNVEYTGKAFLGLTFNCAHCHDHKYDPISHDDYFRMRAFFEPIGIRQDRIAGEAEPPVFQPYVYAGSRKVVREGMVRVYDERPDAPTWFYTGGDERNRVEDRGSIAAGVPEFLGVPFSDITSVDLPMSGWYPGSRPNIQQAILADGEARIAAAGTRLDEARAKPVDTSELQAKLKQAETNLEAALAAAIQSGESGALAGTQSLVMDAPSGRRILQHELPGLKSLPDGSQIKLKLAILKDGHFNIQLARDSMKSLTALYFAFEKGQIKAYKPGSFTVFVAGQFPVATASGYFDITLTLQPAKDVARLLVEFIADDERVKLVDETPIALNEWDPSKNAHQPLTFDCRSGTRVLIDDVRVVAGTQSWEYDFEPPHFSDGEEVVGYLGWSSHVRSTGSATSLISAVAGCTSAQAANDELQQTRKLLNAATRHIRTAELRLQAAKLAMTRTQATIAADNAVRDHEPAEIIQKKAKAAWVAQLVGDEADARWRIADLTGQLTQAESLPDTDKEKAKQVKTLASQLATARTELQAVLKRKSSTPTSVEYAKLSPVTSPQSTGRRRALAEWITHPKNPLTPRVAINHIWMRHMHSPLVASVADFGRNGKPPSHPELLDWLAVELVENNWSMKHIHRLIVTSRTYGMSSSAARMEANLAIDRENRYLWRMNAGRMEAEVIRDSLLAIAGLLDMTRGGQVLPNTQASKTFRRSLYYEIYPEDGGHIPVAAVFDAPDPGECFRRTSTVVPQQALALSNSEVVHTAATETAKSIHASAEGDGAAFVDTAFRKILSRQPTNRELEASIQFLTSQRRICEEESAVLESFVRVLFNHNDFVTIR